MALTKVTDIMTTGEHYNVLAYGATGDGSTDDEVAIEAAYTEAALNGGTVFFPSTGNAYKFLTAITAPANTHTVFEPGATLMGDSSSIFTFLGTMEDTMHQVFESTMEAEFSAEGAQSTSLFDFVRPEWWVANTTPGTTDMTTAFTLAVAGTSAVIGYPPYIKLGRTIYGITNVILPPSTVVKGEGIFNSKLLRLSGSTGIGITDSGNATKINLIGFTLDCDDTAGNGIEMGNNATQWGGEAWIRDVRVLDAGGQGAKLNGNVAYIDGLYIVYAATSPCCEFSPVSWSMALGRCKLMFISRAPSER
jgi:hypothetical protein